MTEPSTNHSSRTQRQGRLSLGDFSEKPQPRRHERFLSAAFEQPLSSSSISPELYWASLFAEFSTFHNDHLVPSFSEPPPVRQVLPSTHVQLAAIQGFFALTKTQLATVCGVQRQTIYDWYAEKFEAEAENAKRLTRLYLLVEHLKAKGLSAISGRESVRPLSTGETLIDLLADEGRDARQLSALIQQLNQNDVGVRARGAAAIRQRLGWSPPTEEETKATLEGNLVDAVDR